MIIHIATDHAGLDLKNSLKEYLNSKGYEVVDHGANIPLLLDDMRVLMTAMTMMVSNMMTRSMHMR